MADVKILAGSKPKNTDKHRHHHHGHDDKTIEADYVIVGLGTAGAVLARFLSDRIDGEFKNSVLVIEAGPNFTTDGDPADRARVAQGAPFGDETIADDPKMASYQKMDTGDAAPGSLAYTGGRMWGGGSCHNDMETWRGTPDIYDDWATFTGNVQWSYDNLLPFMKFMENYVPNGTVPNLAQRGTFGALTIAQDPPLGDDPGQAVLQAAFASGANAPAIADYNDPTLGDVGTSAHQWFSTPPPNPRRSSSSQAYLPTDIVTPDGQGVAGRRLKIISKATVLNLTLNTSGPSPEATGVTYFVNDKRDVILTAKARTKVILCLGSVNTPAILQRAGIGDPALLAQFGIPVVFANPNVGPNGRNHYGPAAVIPTGNNPVPNPEILAGNVDLSGTAAHPTGQVNDGIRRYQIIGLVGQDFFPEPAVLTALGVQDVPAYTLISLNLVPRAPGAVAIASLDPLTQPELSVDCYEDTDAPTDLDRAVQFFRMAANVSLAYTGQMPLWPPASHFPVTDPTPYPGAAAPDDSQLRQDAEQIVIQAFHLTGTCRMAASPADGVVDAKLDVFGVGKLAICDNSVIPEQPTGNTSYQAYLLGLKKAQIEGAQIP